MQHLSTLLPFLIVVAVKQSVCGFTCVRQERRSIIHQKTRLPTQLLVGPRSEGRRRARRGSSSSSSSSPRSAAARRRRTKRQEGSRETTTNDVRFFDAKSLVAAQSANEGAPRLDLGTSSSSDGGGLRCVSDDNLHLNDNSSPLVQHPSFEFLSLNVVLEGLSELFNRDGAFRMALRDAIRQDIFYTTPAYANLSDKATAMLLQPDSSLQGSWWQQKKKNSSMSRLSLVLRDAFGEDKAPSGEDFMARIGALCGKQPSTHWMDIVGVQDRVVSHSWHLDTGLSPQDSMTVLWGFPPEDHYEGCGVFSHVVALQNECHSPRPHQPQDGAATSMEPILFAGQIDERFIVRPMYAPGKELLRYRDIDVLHSSPDVAFRTSIMRFM